MSGSGWEVFTRISSECWEFLKGPIDDLSDVICDIAIFADDTTSLSVIRHLICGNNYNWLLLNLNLIYETLWTRAGSGLLISMMQKLNWFPLTDLITLVLLM